MSLRKESMKLNVADLQKFGDLFVGSDGFHNLIKWNVYMLFCKFFPETYNTIYIIQLYYNTYITQMNLMYLFLCGFVSWNIY